jgi:hypothetical protein
MVVVDQIRDSAKQLCFFGSLVAAWDDSDSGGCWHLSFCIRFEGKATSDFMKNWQPSASGTRIRPQASVLARVVTILVCLFWLLQCDIHQGAAQFLPPRSEADSQLSTVGTAKVSPQPLRMQYVPPVHRKIVKRPVLLPISQNSGVEVPSNLGSHLSDPQYEDFTIDPARPSKWATGRQLSDPIQTPQSGPFLSAPILGPQTLEPEYAADPAFQGAPGGSLPIDQAEESGQPGPFAGRQNGAFRPNYWIISSRKCAQSTSPCDADACTEYFYRGPSGQIEPKTATEFYQSLNPAIPVCFMIHGSLIDWEQNLREGHATFEWLKQAAPETPFQLVLFTWPSERSLSVLVPIDFSVLGRRSSFNGLYLGRVLSRVPATISVSLIGHSHGARLAVSSLHLLGGGQIDGFRLTPQQQSGPRIRTVLAAAAMDHQWLDPGQRFDKALPRTESLLNLKNQTDVPLMLYPFPMLLGYDSLGRAGFNWYDRYALGPEYGKVRNVDVTFLLGVRHVWPRFHAHPEIARLLAPYAFFEQDVPLQSSVKREWQPNVWHANSPEGSAQLLAQPSPRSNSAGKSTLTRGTSPAPVRRSVDRDVEVSLESSTTVRTPTAARAFPRSANPRNP